MELVPWEPFGELRMLRRETEDFWSRSFDEPPFPDSFWKSGCLG